MVLCSSKKHNVEDEKDFAENGDGDGDGDDGGGGDDDGDNGDACGSLISSGPSSSMIVSSVT